MDGLDQNATVRRLAQGLLVTLDQPRDLAEQLADGLDAPADQHVPLCGATGAAPSCPACATEAVRRGGWTP